MGGEDEGKEGWGGGGLRVMGLGRWWRGEGDRGGWEVIYGWEGERGWGGETEWEGVLGGDGKGRLAMSAPKKPNIRMTDLSQEVLLLIFIVFMV